MTLLSVFAFVAGIVTVLSPCILPVLPIILSGSVGGKTRPLGIIAGFTASFTVFTLTLSAVVRALAIPPDLLRVVAASVVLAFGLVMVIPFLKERFSAFVSALASRAPSGRTVADSGFVGGLAVGVSLGLVWTPCVGPIMASVVSLSLSGRIGAESVVITLAYTAGTSVPLFLVMIGGRALLNRLPFLSRNADKVQKAFGALMVITAVALFSGADRVFQSWILDLFPNYGSGLTAIEERDSVRMALDERLSVVGEERDNGPDPLSLGSGVWINSPPMTLSGLKGKVVMIDFWTYSCVNCVRTLPYLRAWHEKYAGAGLVIVGVHTPEFAFERSESNVRKATVDLGVLWPVAMDNDYGIWNAYSNRYWPAYYLYDREGKLVKTHFGEGAYDETEALIGKLLGVSTRRAEAPIPGTAPIAEDRTPETYLGYGRGERFSSPEDPAADKTAVYSLPKEGLAVNRWALEGEWTIGSESSVSGPGASLVIRFKAAKVYLVASPASGGRPNEAYVSLDGAPLDGGDVRGGLLRFDSDRLYRVVDKDVPMESILRIEFSAQSEVYAFTFG